MSIHATLGIQFPDRSISACYVHCDGASMKPRIQSFLEEKTTTGLAVLIAEAQGKGGMWSFYCPACDGTSESVTDFLDDDSPYVIDDENWDDCHFGATYRYLVDYETSDVRETGKRRK